MPWLFATLDLIILLMFEIDRTIEKDYGKL